MVLFAMYISYALIQQQSMINNYNKQINELNTSIAAKEEELEDLDNMEKLYRSDENMERIARDRLGLVLPDETVFVDVTGK